VQQQVGIGGFLQGRLERLNQRVRQVADEADGVGQGDAALDVLEVQLAGGGVEGREQLVGGVGLGVDQGVEERRLAGIGVADERDAEGLVALARPALRAALLLDLVELLLDRLDALADHPPVELDLRLARAAARADAAALTLEVAPAAHQPGREVLQRASSTWSLPSWLRARSPKISRISIVRSATATPRCFSRLRCCAGESAWSKTTTSAW
jgi:hypothetical protein